MSGGVSPRLIAVGDNCLDVYLTRNFLAVGGNALNVAVQWRRGGWQSRYFGAVGTDAEAEIVLSEITSAGLAAQDVERRPGDTGVTLVTHERGDRQFLLELLGVGEMFWPSKAHYADLGSADWVHLGTNSNPDLVVSLLADGIPFSIDISTRPDSVPLRGIPLLFVSAPDDDPVKARSLARELLDAGARRVVVTCGAEGAVYCDEGGTEYVPATPTSVVDTCGAGDSFIAAFVAALRCERLSAAACLHRASEAAAETCSHLGGFPQQGRPIPTWLLDRHRSVMNHEGA